MGGKIFSAFTADMGETSFHPLTLASANKQLRHMRVLSVHYYEDNIQSI